MTGKPNEWPRKVASLVLALLLVSSGVVMAGSTGTDHREILQDDSFTSFDTGVWTLVGSGSSYESSNDRVQLTDGTNKGAVYYDPGVPNNDSWAVSWQTASNVDGTGTILEFYADKQAAPPSNSYTVVIQSGKNEVKILNRTSGSSTTLASTSHTITASEDVTVEFDSGTVNVHVSGTHVLKHTIDNVDTSHQQLGVRAWPGFDAAEWHITQMQVYGAVPDSDGDGLTDHVDPYPNNAPSNTTLTPNDGENVSSAYVEASGGSATLKLYGVDSDGTETLLADSSIDAGSTTTLYEMEAVDGYAEYRLYEHGNATIETTGLLYETTGGGGISEDTFSSGVSQIIGSFAFGFRSLQRGQMVIAALIITVGGLLLIKD